MADWIRRLYGMGIKSVRLHLLEVDHDSVRDSLALSARENIQALLAFAEVQASLAGLRFDLFEEMEALLSGQDAKVGCTWRACDPYTTEAVQGVEGNGQSSNCGRTNKEGIGFTKASEAGYERYLALYRTPQPENGCAGCRFFLMCKGQCPGTSIDGDWRNRTEHCEEWKHLFGAIERRMILAGKIPLTIQPLRFELERRQIEAWERGENPSISRSLGAWYKERASGGDSAAAPGAPRAADDPKPKARISWVGEQARERWQGRLVRLPIAIEELTVHAARVSGARCAVRLVPESSFDRLLGLAAEHGLGAAILPAEALPGGICTRPAEAVAGVFLAGAPDAAANAQAAWERRDLPAFQALIDLPACCLRHGSDAAGGDLFPAHRGTVYLPESVAAHPLLAPLGISALPVAPCRLDCPSALEAAEQWLEVAAGQGYAAEAGWLRECFSWAISWSELHGVTEVKTPLFKMCLETGSALRTRTIRRAGTSAVEGSAAGLSFPYAAPAPQPHMIQIGLASLLST
jgi:radical SAM protein with 4Fe4S-binding SPASM domain